MLKKTLKVLGIAVVGFAITLIGVFIYDEWQFDKKRAAWRENHPLDSLETEDENVMD